LFTEKLRAAEDSRDMLASQMAKLEEQLQRPVQDRARKARYVNGLRLDCRKSKTVLLAGHKGHYKTSFLYWYGVERTKPIKTFADATKVVASPLGSGLYCDSIGLTSWDLQNILKLIVLLLEQGIGNVRHFRHTT